jgi:hypothetical protein
VEVHKLSIPTVSAWIWRCPYSSNVSEGPDSRLLVDVYPIVAFAFSIYRMGSQNRTRVSYFERDLI